MKLLSSIQYHNNTLGYFVVGSLAGCGTHYIYKLAVVLEFINFQQQKNKNVIIALTAQNTMQFFQLLSVCKNIKTITSIQQLYIGTEGSICMELRLIYNNFNCMRYYNCIQKLNPNLEEKKLRPIYKTILIFIFSIYCCQINLKLEQKVVLCDYNSTCRKFQRKNQSKKHVFYIIITLQEHLFYYKN
eukprot:TRINITY_DN7337_c0_g1_i6.p2 TRINITY_DN7337_c0_g1~~TRINITY_DN7337_c0_g1_i6.p2  ORF type:complete len:187 (+),score=-8.17 TRINITY_DN7337_c0_g1_i6:1245-1805(+)